MDNSLQLAAKSSLSYFWNESISPSIRPACAGTRRWTGAWTWDNWFQELAPEEKGPIVRAFSRLNPAAATQLCHPKPCYVLGYLSAPRRYVDGPDGPENHHFHSALGIAVTNDFRRYQVISDCAFEATPREGSIWSGSFVRGGRRCEGQPSEYYFFYTHRDTHSAHPMHQVISVARTENFLTFDRCPLTVTADSRWYETGCIDGDTSTHAFRDPYPFKIGGRAYMLLTAKSKFLEPGKLGERAGRNGVIAVYRTRACGSLSNWEATPLCFDVGKSEAEIPTIYRDPTTGEHVVLFSSKSDQSYLARRRGSDGGPVCEPNETGELYLFRVRKLEALLRNPPERPVRVDPEIIRAVPPGGYAYRFTPDGRLLGFNGNTGRPSVLPPLKELHLAPVDRDFAEFKSQPLSSIAPRHPGQSPL